MKGDLGASFPSRGGGPRKPPSRKVPTRLTPTLSGTLETSWSRPSRLDEGHQAMATPRRVGGSRPSSRAFWMRLATVEWARCSSSATALVGRDVFP